MLKSFSMIALLTLAIAGCNPVGEKNAANSETTTDSIPLVGDDKDEHGCISSAGYQWSKLKNECVRVFEAGIRLNAPAEAGDAAATSSAFIILKDDMSQAELFLPDQKESVILERDGTAGNTWVAGNMQLTQADGYVLKDADKVIYQGG